MNYSDHHVANVIELNPIRVLIVALMMMNKGWACTQEKYDFSSDRDMSKWYIVDNVMMGGRSDGEIKLSDEGNAILEAVSPWRITAVIHLCAIVRRRYLL